MGVQNKALISYRVPREGGDPDPFTQAVSVMSKRKQERPSPNPLPQGEGLFVLALAPFRGRGLGEGVIHALSAAFQRKHWSSGPLPV